MKSIHALVFIVTYVSLVDADTYMHCPRGSNNRLNEKSAARTNGNRLFDSQNNARGGYNIGDLTDKPAESYEEQYRMEYITSPLDPTKGESIVPILWTNQHGCGPNEDDNPAKLNCNLVLQMMCQPHDDAETSPQQDTMRDGLNTDTQEYEKPQEQESKQQFQQRKNNRVKIDRGLHDPFEWYDKCVTRKRNKGLFIADQKLKGDTSKYTRQNPQGTRRGYECPEERDYYPYWHPTPWKDIKVLAERQDRCDFYQKNSFNVAPKWECVEKWSDGSVKHYSEHNNKADCEAHNGVWTEFHNYLEILPDNEATCKAKNSAGLLKDKLIWARPMFHTNVGQPLVNDQKKCLVKLDEPECEVGPYTRVNHLGNGVDMKPLKINWKVPAFPSGQSQKCVLRMRYNISTDDYNVENPVLPKELVKTYTWKNDIWAMGQYGPLPRERRNEGYFYIGTEDKLPYKAGEYVTYVKTNTGTKGLQWLGWKSHDFKKRELKYKFAIYFENKVPAAVTDLGFKVYGVINNDWLATCKPDEWCNVEEKVTAGERGDGEHVILIFDGLTDPTKVHFADFSVEVYEDGHLIEENPTLDIDAVGSGIKLAINTAQFGRTFQDRTHVSTYLNKDKIFTDGETLHHLCVAGKRGNIVQTFPAHEYDFFPTNLVMKSNDLLHICWTGSNTHNNGNPAGDGQAGNDGQGQQGTDRHNIMSLGSRDQNFPLTFNDPNNICNKITDIVWSKYPVHPTDPAQAKKDICIQLMSSGYYKCIENHSACNNENLIGATKPLMDNQMNNAPATFCGVIVKFDKGEHNYTSTRNNNFTNRSQKATLIVT